MKKLTLLFICMYVFIPIIAYGTAYAQVSGDDTPYTPKILPNVLHGETKTAGGWVLSGSLVPAIIKIPNHAETTHDGVTFKHADYFPDFGYGQRYALGKKFGDNFSIAMNYAQNNAEGMKVENTPTEFAGAGFARGNHITITSKFSTRIIGIRSDYKIALDAVNKKNIYLHLGYQSGTITREFTIAYDTFVPQSVKRTLASSVSKQKFSLPEWGVSFGHKFNPRSQYEWRAGYVGTRQSDGLDFGIAYSF